MSNWAWGAIVCAAAAAGFAYGRTGVEPRIVEVERVVEVGVEREQEARIDQGPITITRDRTVTREVPGAERVVTVERVVEKQGPTVTITKEGEVISHAEYVRIAPPPPALPDWSATVGAGIGWDPAVPISGPLVLQGAVERRIFGDLHAGAWVSTQGAAGVQVSYRW